MLMSVMMFMMISNAVSLSQDKSILFSSTVIQTLLFTSFMGMHNLYMAPLESGVAMYGGLLNVNVLTQTFNIFVFLVNTIMLMSNTVELVSSYILKMSSSYVFMHNIAMAFTLLLTTIMSELKKITINDVIYLLIFSVCMKTFYWAISWMFTPTMHNNMYFIFLGIMVIIMALSLMSSKDKLGHIMNIFLSLLVIMVFWSTVASGVGFFFEIEIYSLLTSFISCYESDGLLHTDLGVPPWLKDVLSKAFQSLDDSLNFSNFHPGGPGSILIYHDPNTDKDIYSYTQLSDSLMESEEEYSTTQYSDAFKNYHKADHWDLSDKYYQLAGITSFIDKYNDSLPHKTNWHISKANEMAAIHGTSPYLPVSVY